ncbi:MAG: phosphoribosyltransferase family protein [bacterium]
MIRRFWYGLLDLFLPVRCFICGAVVGTKHGSLPVCEADIAALPRLPAPQCLLCARPLATPGLSPEFDDPHPICGDCRRQTCYQQFTLIPFAYRGSLKKIIADWKFSGHQQWGDFLGKLLADYLLTKLRLEDWDYVTYVPLHEEKLKLRGFNQAAQLAEAIGEKSGIVPAGLLDKRRQTGAQSELTRKQRLVNLKKAFKPTRKLAGEKILLVDDIYTTGSTLRNASKTILEAGASSVGAVALTRSIPKNMEHIF